MSTHESRTDLSDIRKQLQEINDISQEEKKLTNRYGGQVDTLKQDLALVQKQIEFERERRLDLERTLESERLDQLPQEHIETIRRRDEDIRTVREEKAAMLEWLQRGVDEAQRITLQIEALKGSADQAKMSENEFSDDTRRLQEMEERLTSELDETKMKIKKLTDQRETLQEHNEQQNSVLGVTTDIVKSTESDISRLEGDLDKLRGRARDVETIEIAMGCMAASVRRTVHELDTMQHAVNTGNFPADDGYDSGQDADDTTFSPVVLTSTKAKIGRCDALLSTLWSSMKRFDQDSGTRNAANTARHNALVQTMLKDLEQTKKSVNEDLVNMREESAVREPQLRRFIQLRDDALKSYEEFLSASPGEDHKAFDLIGYIETETEKLRDHNTKLVEDNHSLKTRTESQEEDYMAVKTLKREYRDMEAQRTMLSHAIRTAEVSNKEMKFFLFEQGNRGSPIPQKNQHGGMRSGSRTPGSGSKQRAPWRSPTME